MSDVTHHKWWGWGVEGIAFHHEDKPAFAPFVYEKTAIDLSEPSAGARLDPRLGGREGAAQDRR